MGGHKLLLGKEGPRAEAGVSGLPRGLSFILHFQLLTIIISLDALALFFQGLSPAGSTPGLKGNREKNDS